MKPGWYPDPDDSTIERWWTGKAWTTATRDPEADRDRASTSDARWLWAFVVLAGVIGFAAGWF